MIRKCTAQSVARFVSSISRTCGLELFLLQALSTSTHCPLAQTVGHFCEGYRGHTCGLNNYWVHSFSIDFHTNRFSLGVDYVK